MAMLCLTTTSRALVVLIAAAACALAHAQSETTQLAPVLVTGQAPVSPGLTGWGELPLARLPLQASVFGAEQIKNSGARRLADLVAFDPALGDAYNAEGYWDFLTVRGFVLDNRFNYRRDGLPINAETSIALGNKARVEILKGLSGMQAGTSAPGGLVNYVVKRPAEASISSASLEWRERASVAAGIDLSRRFGDADVLGLRLNVDAGKVDPQVRSAKGDHHLFALAADWRASPATRIEVEGESSRRSQPSVPGFSMLGNNVPDARSIDPRINLNNQAWTQPVALEGHTASLRITQRLASDWSLVAHGMTQRLRSDDRIAFPFGCTDPNPPPNGTYYADRFCPNGDFDLYEFRSDNERRRVHALDVSVSGKFTTGAVRHQVHAGLLRSIYRARFGQQVFDFAGTGNLTGSAQVAPSPGTLSENTNRDERSGELYLRDALSVDDRSTLWLGMRRTHLNRSSERTDGTQATHYAQTLHVPFVGASHQLSRAQMIYASWGQGVESEVVPNLPIYSNRGVALPALKSRQLEAGLKGATEQFEWSASGFDVVRPMVVDAGAARVVDGNARHRGVELTGAAHLDAWTLRGGSQWLRARRENSRQSASNGLHPTNVPAFTLKGEVSYAVADVPGMDLQADAVREGPRRVLPDNSASIPGYTRFDAALRYDIKAGQARWTLRAGVDNLTDQRAWKESPTQFSHVYLFPLAPRTWRVSVQAEL